MIDEIGMLIIDWGIRTRAAGGVDDRRDRNADHRNKRENAPNPGSIGSGGPSGMLEHARLLTKHKMNQRRINEAAEEATNY
jgi:hypothetical protein